MKPSNQTNVRMLNGNTTTDLIGAAYNILWRVGIPEFRHIIERRLNESLSPIKRVPVIRTKEKKNG